MAARVVVGVTGVSPDCRAGKHGACVGDAWDDVLDAPAECSCDCHGAHRARSSGRW